MTNLIKLQGMVSSKTELVDLVDADMHERAMGRWLAKGNEIVSLSCPGRWKSLKNKKCCLGQLDMFRWENLNHKGGWKSSLWQNCKVRYFLKKESVYMKSGVKTRSGFRDDGKNKSFLKIQVELS